MRHQLFFGAAAAALMIPAAAYAQETTATIQGTVTSGGAPVSGAQITITHTPTGTVSKTVSNKDGGYSAAGLRIGGPYKIDVSSPKGSASVTDVYAVAGQAFTLPIDVASTEIVVSAAQVKGAGAVSLGPSSVLNAAQISQITSVNRDIRDIMAHDPFANLDVSSGASARAVSFAGVNPRFNRFTVDGVPITDSFGLNSDALPSRRGPVPLDAIAQFETKVAPYDIREGFFEGGVTNAILKSGTNEFHGTGFYSYDDNSLTGNQTKPYTVGGTTADGHVTVLPFSSKDYGAEISGPIIKDTLFFMVAAERVRASLPLYSTNFAPDNLPIAVLTAAQLAQITSIANTVYHVDPGGILSSNNDSDDRIVAKLDANLSNTQRLSITGFYTKDSINTVNSTGTTTLSTVSSDYVKPNKVFGGVVQLNSDWSPTLSTELRVRYKDYESGQTPFSPAIAFATICTDAGSAGAVVVGGTPTSCSPNVPTVTVGPPGSAAANVLSVKTWGGSFLARKTVGDHAIRLLVQAESSDNYDLFLATTVATVGSSGPYGAYYFNSIAAFQAQQAQAFGLSNASNLNQASAAAAFSYQTYTFGLQDDWRVSSTFRVSYGVRYDLYGGRSVPLLNTNFLAREGFANTSYIDGRSLLQPRFGFEWKPLPNVDIHGGGGLFGGGTPDVYVANSFSASGVQPVSLSSCPVALTNVSLTTVPAACNSALSNSSLTTNGSVSALSPNFKIPSQWRATLSGNWHGALGPLGGGWNFGGDVLFSKVRDAIFVTDARDRPIVGASALTPDGRQRYFDIVCNNNSTSCSSDGNGDYILGDTNKGRTWVGVVHFAKKFDFGIGIDGSFTYEDARDLQALTSSVASSNYNNGGYLDPNGGAYGHSNDEVRYQFKYDLTFDHAFFRDYKTRFAIFGDTRIGSPYSYTFADAAATRNATFGTINSTNPAAGHYLLYVPTGLNDPLITYDSVNTANAVDAFINAHPDLAKYRGTIAPRNAFNSSWFTVLNLHVEQEIPTFVGKSRITLFADIENFTNLLNSNWGQQLRATFSYDKALVQVSCVAAGANSCAQYKYSSIATATTLADQLIVLPSLYTIRIGARFSF